MRWCIDGHKVNFARGKIPSGARDPESVYIAYQTRRRPNIVQSLTSVERRRCSNVAKTRNPLKYGVPQTNETISAAGRLKFTIWHIVGDIWRTYCCLTSFFPIVDTCPICEDIARQTCAIVPRWRFLRHFCVLYFQRAACSTFQTCILNSH